RRLRRPSTVQASQKCLMTRQDVLPVLGRAVDGRAAGRAEAAIPHQPPEVVRKLFAPLLRQVDRRVVLAALPPGGGDGGCRQRPRGPPGGTRQVGEPPQPL